MCGYKSQSIRIGCDSSSFGNEIDNGLAHFYGVCSWFLNLARNRNGDGMGSGTVNILGSPRSSIGNARHNAEPDNANHGDADDE